MSGKTHKRAKFTHRQGAPQFLTHLMRQCIPPLDEYLMPDLTNVVLHFLPEALEGNLIRQFGSIGSGNGQFNFPAGVAVWKELILVADCINHRVCVHRSADSSFVGSFGELDLPQVSLKHPFGIAVCEANDHLMVFVTEIFDCCVSSWRLEVVNSRQIPKGPVGLKGTLLRRWGKKGSENGQFNYPKDIALSLSDDSSHIAESSFVIVADDLNHRIQVFNFEGSFIRAFGSRGSAPGQLHRPFGICLNSTLLYVTEVSNDRISVFNATDGSFVRHIGLGHGSGNGQLNGPMGIAVADEWLAVADYENQCVSVFDKHNGLHFQSFSAKNPDSLCWNQFDNTLVTTDSINNFVKIFE